MEFMFKDSGEHPIRLLTSDADDKEEFLYALKRAVFRSDNVIIVGGLNEKHYLPGLLSSAIGVPCVKVDYRALGFEESEKPLMFPSRSIPLVTPDREIGGFLIEKGRQAIIMLSEMFEVRRKLLENLIMPYIFDSRRVSGSDNVIAADHKRQKADAAEQNLPEQSVEPSHGSAGETGTPVIAAVQTEVDADTPTVPPEPDDTDPTPEPEKHEDQPERENRDEEAQEQEQKAEPETPSVESCTSSADELQRLIDSLPDPSGNVPKTPAPAGRDDEDEDLSFDEYLDFDRRMTTLRYINIGAAAALIIAGLALLAAVLFKLI